MRLVDADFILKRLESLAPIGDVGKVTIEQCIAIVKNAPNITREE